MEGTHIDGWVGVTSRDGFIQKVPNNVRERVVDWIIKHHHIIHSPIAKEEMVYNENGKKLISEKMIWALCLP